MIKSQFMVYLIYINISGWKDKMKRLVIGILAHVDSGKTTLSEGLLYEAGEIRKLGRVDRGDAFLDTNKIERDRGITIFSKQAVISLPDAEFTLVDTPGHIDFSAETERALQILDYAVLVISATDGVRSHTETLWRLLKMHNIPTFIFINKMDLPDTSTENIMKELTERLSDGCLDFSNRASDDFAELSAMCSESLMNEFLEKGAVSDVLLSEAIGNREIFPCFFGSALKLEGVREFADSLNKFTAMKKIGSEFGARVYKISEDERGARLTHMKITGGSLKVKSILNGEKANELRIYSGEKYQSIPEAFPGMVCAVTGLSSAMPGEGLGNEKGSAALTLEPVFTYAVRLPQGCDIHTAIANFKRLEEEETQLHVIWNEQLQEIRIQLMGEVQLEVLKSIIAERFGMEVEFEQGSIIYKETIANRVEGVGHYEPLRHYAEVHLLLEPGKPGSGIKLAAKCSEEALARNWQRLILTHLEEKEHIGILTGSPLTDTKITLVAGKAHLKHTEGGDFRQATYRAVRQGLMQAESVLLEPWYDFVLELPTASVGRAMTDIDRMGGNFEPPETNGDTTVIKGCAPVSKMRDYHTEVTSYTHGTGRLSCILKGYEPCSNADEIIEEIGYNADADIDNTSSSVFCSHGAGFTVKWDEVFEHMHLPALDLDEPKAVTPTDTTPVKQRERSFADDSELMKIFEQTYGKIKHPAHHPMRTLREEPKAQHKITKYEPKLGDYLLVDGYNIIFAWEELRKMSELDLELARTTLVNRLCAYRAMRKTEVIVVFDAYKVKGNPGSVEKVLNISVVYTKEAETADSYIEKVSHQLGKNYNVRVATSDYMEQIIILGSGAFRVSANEFLKEVEAAEAELKELMEKEY